MSRLIAILKAAHCRSTHHYFAIDALDQINTAQGQRLGQLLLKYHDEYLVGAQAPDNSFRDFENHVLYVAEDPPWGGAIEACERWRQTTVEHLNAGRWKKAAYACGVLSHYFTDPMMPLHTTNSDQAAVLHRAWEWRVFKTYRQLSEASLLRSRSLDMRLSQDSDWISEAVLTGARLANRYFQPLLNAYDAQSDGDKECGSWSPEVQGMLTELIGMTVTGWAQALVRLADETTRKIPDLSLNITTLLALVDMPLAWSVRRGSEAAQRRAIGREMVRSGHVRHSLPAEVRKLRELKQQPLSIRPEKAGTPANVLQASEPLGADSELGRNAHCVELESASTATRSNAPRVSETSAAETDSVRDRDARTIHAIAEDEANGAISKDETTLASTRDSRRLDGIRLPEKPNGGHLRRPVVRVPLQPASDRRRLPVRTPTIGCEREASTATEWLELSPADDLASASVIGDKTARRFQKLGIRTVGVFLETSIEDLVAAFNAHWLTPTLVRDWQDQLRLLCAVPSISWEHVELLVELGYCDAERLAWADVDAFQQQLIELGKTPTGNRLLAGKPIPKRSEIAAWIDGARRCERYEPGKTEKRLQKLA